jgi:cell wall-associated NlpC family hydrolase
VEPVTQAALAAAQSRGLRRLLWGAVITSLVVAAGTVLAAAGLLAGLFSSASQVQPQVPGQFCMTAAGPQQPYTQWSAEQMTNAATIVRTGQADRVPPYGWIIAVATAMQESTLINLDYGDRDSLGLFQQRPSKGWGTPAQIMDPVYASNAFYQHLLKVPGWQHLPLTVAAQDVQHSGFPGAYAQWQQPATAVVTHLTHQASLTAAGGVDAHCTAGQVPAGTPAQLRAVLAYAYSALGTLYQFGGTCTNPHSSNMALHCDCSSLVQQSFARAGLHLPRTAAAQWEWGEAGHAMVVPLGQAQVGDVVYRPSYLGPDTIAHTGIVVNPKKMIMIDAYDTGLPVRFDTYRPSALPYGRHLLTILRFINIPGIGGQQS